MAQASFRRHVRGASAAGDGLCDGAGFASECFGSIVLFELVGTWPRSTRKYYNESLTAHPHEHVALKPRSLRKSRTRLLHTLRRSYSMEKGTFSRGPRLSKWQSRSVKKRTMSPVGCSPLFSAHQLRTVLHECHTDPGRDMVTESTPRSQRIMMLGAQQHARPLNELQTSMFAENGPLKNQ